MLDSSSDTYGSWSQRNSKIFNFCNLQCLACTDSVPGKNIENGKKKSGPRRSSIFSGIICGPFWGSFAVLGSFAAPGSFAELYRSTRENIILILSHGSGICTLLEASPWGFCTYELTPPWGINIFLEKRQMPEGGGGGWAGLELTEPLFSIIS